MKLVGKSRPLCLEAAISIQIDGSPAQLTGEGAQLWLALEQPATVARLLEGNLSFARRAADLLAQLGLTLTIRDEEGTLIHAGRDVRSRASRLVFGTSHLAIAHPAALIRLLRGYLGRRR